MKQTISQSLTLFRQNRLLGIISVLGTALAICLIMCIVLIYRVRTSNYEPEVNRSRTLVVRTVLGRNINDAGWNNGGRLSLRTIKECFYTLRSARTVTAVSNYSMQLAATPGGETEVKCNVSYTDDAFWRMFEFRFLSGQPYGKEFLSGERKAVISRKLARHVFGTDEVVGRTLTLSFVDYRICGVVADVSVLAENAYAEVWIPYTTMSGYEQNYCDGLLGGFQCFIEVPAEADVETVRQEAIRNVDRMNAGQKEFKLILSGAPDTPLMSMSRQNMFEEPSVVTLILTYVVVVFLLLLVPAINLSGITLSRMRMRMEEIGVRRAFGATRGEVLRQVLTENLLLTLLGGVVGLVFSYGAVLWLREWLFNTPMSGYYGVSTEVTTGMLLSPGVFVAALCFCLLMNLLSAGIPAWRVSRANIVKALK